MAKKRLIELIKAEEIENYNLSAPFYFLEGEQNSEAAKNAMVFISRFKSSFYNSNSYFTLDFYKPLSQFQL